jgi:hypothetical protein
MIILEGGGRGTPCPPRLTYCPLEKIEELEISLNQSHSSQTFLKEYSLIRSNNHQIPNPIIHALF